LGQADQPGSGNGACAIMLLGQTINLQTLYQMLYRQLTELPWRIISN